MLFVNVVKAFWQLLGTLSGRAIAPLLMAVMIWLVAIIPATAATTETGKEIFEGNCASCHTIDGSGTAIGPDLSAVAAVRDRSWLKNWIGHPDEMIASGDPIATELLEKYNGIPMPAMGLDDEEVEAVVAYLSDISSLESAGGAIEASAVATVPAATAKIEAGKEIFEGNCASCHTIDGSGTAIGPDLSAVAAVRDRSWLKSWIGHPDEMIASGDPIATELLEKYNGIPMPAMGLEDEEVEGIVAYLEAISSQESVGTNPSAVANSKSPIIASGTSDAQTGAKLFAGEIAFANGGPACMSCHTAGVGALDGGTLGPNLTHVFQRYGETGLASVLKTLPYPSMQGIYQNKLLAEAEQGHLLAFFKAANARDSAEAASTNILTPSWKFVAIALGGFLLLALLSNLTWRDRFTGVRKRLVGNKQ